MAKALFRQADPLLGNACHKILSMAPTDTRLSSWDRYRERGVAMTEFL